MGYVEDMRLYYSEQPHEVSIETFAYCNARCTFCPYTTLERIGAKMPDELIDRLIDEMAEFKLPFYFSPFKVNEPLLDKRLIPICRKFNEKAPRGYLRIFSNGSALTEKNVEGIAGLKKVVHLWISLNSHDPKEYEELMVIRDSDARINFYAKSDKQVIKEMIMVVDGKMSQATHGLWLRESPRLTKSEAERGVYSVLKLGRELHADYIWHVP